MSLFRFKVFMFFTSDYAPCIEEKKDCVFFPLFSMSVFFRVLLSRMLLYFYFLVTETNRNSDFFFWLERLYSVFYIFSHFLCVCFILAAVKKKNWLFIKNDVRLAKLFFHIFSSDHVFYSNFSTKILKCILLSKWLYIF